MKKFRDVDNAPGFFGGRDPSADKKNFRHFIRIVEEARKQGFSAKQFVDAQMLAFGEFADTPPTPAQLLGKSAFRNWATYERDRTNKPFVRDAPKIEASEADVARWKKQIMDAVSDFPTALTDQEAATVFQKEASPLPAWYLAKMGLKDADAVEAVYAEVSRRGGEE
jgi:hypothetical protein